MRHPEVTILSLAVAGTLVVGCHRRAAQPVAPTAQPRAPAGLVLRSAARPAGLRVQVEAGQRATGDDAQAVWRTLGAIARRHATELGWNAGDEPSEATLASASGPPKAAGAPPFKAYRYLQQAKGWAIFGGEVSVVTAGGQLVHTQGRLHPRAPSEALVDRLLAAHPPTYEAGLPLAEKSCRGVKAEAPGERPSRMLDTGGARLLYVYACGPARIAWDPLAGKVVQAWSTRHGWAVDDDGVDVLSVKDGGPTSPSNDGTPYGGKWFRSNVDRSIPPALTQTFSHVLVDSEPRAGSNCNFRMTYGGGESIPPFPRVQDKDGHTIYVAGSCKGGGTAFTSLDDKFFEYQTVFERLIAMARYAAWSQDFGVFAWWPTGGLKKVTVKVHKTDGKSCDLAWDQPLEHDYLAGWEAGGEICFDAANKDWNRWLTIPHEYGHYVAESYGMDHAGLFESCDAGALDEAIANALALSFVHYRAGAARFSDTQINQLFTNGPGELGAVVGNPGGFASASGPCTKTTADDRKRAIVQVLWSLLTNRYCHGWVGGSCNMQAILGPVGSGASAQPRNAKMTEIARQALTFSIWSDVDNASDFLWTMRAFILVFYPAEFSDDELIRLNAVFDAHNLVPPG